MIGKTNTTRFDLWRRVKTRFSRSVVTYPGRVMGFVLILTLVLAWPLPRLQTRTSIYDLIIEDLTETIQYREFQKRFGTADIIRVVVRSENVLNAETLEKIDAFAGQASTIKGVRRIISLAGIKRAVDPQNRWPGDRFSAVLAPAVLFSKNLVAIDRKATAITVILTPLARHADIISQIDTLLDRFFPGAATYQIGIPVVSEALARYTHIDLLTLTPLVLGIIAVILFCVYKNVYLVLFPIICVVLAVFWTFGIMAWAGIPFSMLTMIVPVFVIAVGTAYALHICSAYRRHVGRVEKTIEAVEIAFSEVSLPTFLAVATTVIGLVSLLVNRISAINHFAVLAISGMGSLLIILLTLLPALLTFIPPERIKPDSPSGISTWLEGFLEKIIEIDLKHQRWVFGATGAALLAGVAGISMIEVETSPVTYFRPGTDIHRHFSDIHRDLSGSFPVNVVVSHPGADVFESAAGLSALADLQKSIASLPKVDKSISFADYLMLVNYVVNRFDPDAYTLPEEDFQVRMRINDYKSLLGEDAFHRFVDPTLSSAHILLMTHLSSSREFLSTRDAILAAAENRLPPGFTVQVTGIGMAVAESSHQLVLGQIKSLWLTVGIVFALMSLLFLSLKVGLVAIATNLFPIAVVFGLMGWTGIELNMASCLIATIAIGLAVDDTIHYLVRYNAEFKSDLDKDRSLGDALRRVGQPILFTTLTISIGFGILMFSHFEPTAIFGLLMGVTMLAALGGDLFLLPALMRHVELVTAWDLLRLMPSLSGISPGIAHELVQPLNTIRMGNDFLKTMLAQRRAIPGEQLREVVDTVDTEVQRATHIIQRLRSLGQQTSAAKQAIDINDPITDTVAILKNQLALDNISIDLDLAPELPKLFAHRQRMGQVFYNLLINAAEAINRKKAADPSTPRHILIKTRCRDSRLTVTVNDSGTGIPIVLRERIFEPFFTTKTKGSGRGLGLSISNQIVCDYGGRFSIQSDAEQGTKVRMTFPVSSAGEHG